MKIFLVGPGPCKSGNITKYYENALKKLGYDVDLFLSNFLERDYIEDSIIKKIPRIPLTLDEMIKRHLYERKKWKLKTLLNQKLIERAVAFSPDLLLMINSFGNLVAAESLAQIKRKKNIPIAAWVCDDPFPYYDNTKCLFHYDHIFVCEPSSIPQIKLLTNRPIKSLPDAVDPEMFRPVELSPEEKAKYDCDICFVGTVAFNTNGSGLFRAKLLEYLSDYQIKIWGNFSWQNLLREIPSLQGSFQGGFLPAVDVNKAYQAAKIVINLHHPFLKVGTGTRTFEAAAASAFQLADKKSELERYFELGKEMICFESVAELKALAKHYLENPQERTAIAERAQTKVLQGHTYVHRVKTILANV